MCIGRAPVIQISEFNGSGLIVVINLVGDAERECTTISIVIHRDIVPATRGESVGLQGDGSLVIYPSCTGNFITSFIPESNLLTLHVAVHITGFDTYFDEVGGSLEFEPYIFQSCSLVVCPAATSCFVGCGIKVAVLRIGRAPVIQVSEFNGASFIVIIDLIGDTKGECSAISVIIHGYIVPATRSEGVGLQGYGSLVIYPPGTTHLNA